LPRLKICFFLTSLTRPVDALSRSRERGTSALLNESLPFTPQFYRNNSEIQSAKGQCHSVAIIIFRADAAPQRPYLHGHIFGW
jgi:hypothetical protein